MASHEDSEAQMKQPASAMHKGRRLWAFRPQDASKTTKTTATSAIPEAKPLLTKACVAAMALLFQVPDHEVRRTAGLLTYARYLEEQFKPLLSDSYSSLWILAGLSGPITIDACWEWLSTALRSIQSFQSKDAPSIEMVYQHLVTKAQNGAGQQTINLNKDAVLLALFAVLCWSSMTLQPVLGIERFETQNAKLNLSLRVEGAWPDLPLATARRPIDKMFREFRTQRRERHVSAGDGQDDGVLHQSCLNFFQLYTIGRVRLKWVDTLTEHLLFDRSARTLSLFRMPTFCACSIRGIGKGNLVRNAITELLLSHDVNRETTSDPVLFHREILLSYRVLFSQSSASRKLIKHILHDQQRDTKLSPDPLLEALCTIAPSQPVFRARKANSQLPAYLFPPSNLDVNDVLIAADTYSAYDDFPNLGSRLLVLQRYNLSQQPSRVRDLWRDRRNPLQWYTFWAVFWIGGISIILGILQLGTSVGQLYFAIKPVR